jgi:hypothetical protein
MPRAGQTAAVVVEVRHGGGIAGASVGDCEAWIFAGEHKIALTENQVRKPLLGEGGRVRSASNPTLRCCWWWRRTASGSTPRASASLAHWPSARSRPRLAVRCFREVGAPDPTIRFNKAVAWSKGSL